MPSPRESHPTTVYAHVHTKEHRATVSRREGPEAGIVVGLAPSFAKLEIQSHSRPPDCEVATSASTDYACRVQVLDVAWPFRQEQSNRTLEYVNPKLAQHTFGLRTRSLLGPHRESWAERLLRRSTSISRRCWPTNNHSDSVAPSGPTLRLGHRDQKLTVF